MAQENRLFRYSLLAASVVAILSAPLTFAAEEGASLEEEPEVITVRGIRSSMVKSMMDKRTSDQVVDTINATDIGKLPDATIADSLQRITGIQVGRSGGEGASVNIRGLPQVLSTLNGEQMLAAGSVTTVQPNFDDIPSTMVNGIDVFKSAQAANLQGGLSGTINLRTIRPLDLDEGFTFNSKATVAKGSMGDETDKKLSLFAGYNLNANTGFSVNISKDKTYLADYVIGSTGEDWGFISSEESNFVEDNVDANSNGIPNDLYYSFQGHTARNHFIERDRTAINASFQHHFNDKLKLTSDIFFTKMKQYDLTAGFTAGQDWKTVNGWYTPLEYTAHADYVDGEPVEGVVFNSVQSAELQARRVMSYSETTASDKEAFNSNLQLDFDDGNKWTASVRWVHGESRNDTATSTVDAYMNDGTQGDHYQKGEGGVNIGPANPWGYSGISAELPDGSEAGDYSMIPITVSYQGDKQVWELPMMTALDSDGNEVQERLGSNRDRYSVTSSYLDGENSNAQLDAIRLDTNYLIDGDHFAYVRAGVRYGTRTVTQVGWIGVSAHTNAYGDAFLARWKDTSLSAPETGESYIDPISFNDELVADKITKISDFQGTRGLDYIYAVDPSAMKDPVAFHQALYGPVFQLATSDSTFEVREDTTSAYLQLDLAGYLFDFSYAGNIGVRYVKTEFDIDQSESGSETEVVINGVTYTVGGTPDAPLPIAQTNNTARSYSDWLPAMNLAIDLTDNLKWRLAASQTVTTHDASNLAGGVVINRDPGCGVTTEYGAQVSCATSGSLGGNPWLDPWRSTNFETSVEWYFNSTGLLSMGFFMLDIESFIQRDQTYVPLPDSDGVIRGYDRETGEFIGVTEVTTLTNADGGKIKGWEIGYQQTLDFLPGLLSYTGITANYTYSPSESGDLDYYGDSTPMMDNSKHSANFAVWYENEGLQARIASNYRSEKYMWQVNQGTHTFARYMEPTLYVDASISYEINDSVTLMLQGTNLTEEVQTQYLQWEDLFDKRNINERKLSFSVQLSL